MLPLPVCAAFHGQCCLGPAVFVCILQDIPSIIEGAKAEQADRLSVQAKMRDPSNADTSVVLYLQVGAADTAKQQYLSICASPDSSVPTKPSNCKSINNFAAHCVDAGVPYCAGSLLWYNCKHGRICAGSWRTGMHLSADTFVPVAISMDCAVASCAWCCSCRVPERRKKRLLTANS